MVVAVEINKHTLLCKFLPYNKGGEKSKNDVKSLMFVSVVFFGEEEGWRGGGLE